METIQGTKDVCRLFFKNEKGYSLELTTYQAIIVKTIFFKWPKRSICTATTRAGKSVGVAIGIILVACFRSGEQIRLIAPTGDHTKIVMGYVVDYLLSSEVLSDRLMVDMKGMGVKRLKKELTKKKLKWKNGSEIMSISANISTAGRSAIGWGGSLVVVDEGEQIPKELIVEKIMRMLGDTEDAAIFMIGNPVVYGFMYDKSTEPGWDFLRVDWKQCVAAGRLTKEFVMERKAEMTKNQFKIWYEAEWPDELEDQLFNQRARNNIFAPLTVEEKELLTLEPDEKALGCDVARFGINLTVIYKLERYDNKWFIMEAKSFSKKATTKTTGQIIAWDREENFDRMNVDDPGVGGGVTDQLKESDQTSERTHAFIPGEQPWKLKRTLNTTEIDNNTHFLNKKAFWYEKFAKEAGKGNIRNVDEKNAVVLHDQLKKLRYEFTSFGHMKIVKDEGKSPDFADAVNIALFTPHKFAFAMA